MLGCRAVALPSTEQIVVNCILVISVATLMYVCIYMYVQYVTLVAESSQNF